MVICLNILKLGNEKYNNLNLIHTDEHVLYYDDKVCILEIKGINHDNIFKIIKKEIAKNSIKIIKEDKTLYYIPTTKSTLVLISNYLTFFISRLLYLKDNKLNILIGFNAFKPIVHYLKYNDNGIILNLDTFHSIKTLNNSLEVFFNKLNEINKDFLLKFKKEVTLVFDLYLNYSDKTYTGSANRNTNELTIYSFPRKDIDFSRLLAHEIGHFYYWEYNKKKLNSNVFFKEFKEHYTLIKNKYINKCYYFQFDPNGQCKFNKKAEYFCEIFSLYLCDELLADDISWFDKHINF